MSTETAALTEPLAVGMHAVEMAASKGGEVPLVIGCGPIGLATIAALAYKRKARSLPPIIRRCGVRWHRSSVRTLWSIRRRRRRSRLGRSTPGYRRQNVPNSANRSSPAAT